jgi:hypothetical protein
MGHAAGLSKLPWQMDWSHAKSLFPNRAILEHTQVVRIERFKSKVWF